MLQPLPCCCRDIWSWDWQHGQVTGSLSLSPGRQRASGQRLDRTALSPQAFPDNAARREVESLPAACPSEGCSWKGTLKEYEVGPPVLVQPPG